MRWSFAIYISLTVILNSWAGASPQSFKLVVLEKESGMRGAANEVVSYLKDVLKGAGIQDVELVEAPSERGLQLVDQGKGDALWIGTPSMMKSYPNLIRTHFPFLRGRVDIIYLKSHKQFDPDMLTRYRGVALLNRLEVLEVVQSKGYFVEQVSSQDQAIKMLLEKRVQYAILNLGSLREMFKEDPKMESLLVIAPKPFTETPYYFLLNKKHKNLLPKIEKSFVDCSQKLPKKYLNLKPRLYRLEKNGSSEFPIK